MNVTQNLLTNIQILGWFAGAGSHLFTFYMYLHVKRKKRKGTLSYPNLGQMIELDHSSHLFTFYMLLSLAFPLLFQNEKEERLVEGRGLLR